MKQSDHDQPVGTLKGASQSTKTKLSAISGDIKAFRAKLDQGGLSGEDKSLLDKVITELDGLYEPARPDETPEPPKNKV